METELDEERKQRLAAAGARKKLEADLRMSAQQVDIVTKAKDDIAKQLKRAQVCGISSSVCSVLPVLEKLHLDSNLLLLQVSQ